MVNLTLDHDGHQSHDLSGEVFRRIGRGLLGVLMVFLGLSGPALCYMKAVEQPHTD